MNGVRERDMYSIKKIKTMLRKYILSDMLFKNICVVSLL